MSPQLQRLYSAIPPQESRRFLQYLRSPYFNRRHDLIDYWLSITSQGLEKSPTREEWFSMVYPHQPYNDPKWRLLNSKMVAQLEAFLSTDDKNVAHDIRKRLRLHRILRNKGQQQRLSPTRRKINRALDQLPPGTEKSRIKYEVHRQIAEEKLSSRTLRRVDLEELRYDHERAFVLEALELGCQALAARTLDPGATDPGLLPLVVTYFVTPSRKRQDDLLAMYFYCYQMLREPMVTEHFEEFSLRIPRMKKLAASEARQLTLFAINYCIRRVNDGDPQAGEAALDLYTRGFSEGYLLDQQYISHIAFSNVVALALKARSIQRARNFVDRFAPLLSPRYRSSTEALNRARLAYEEGQLTEAMRYLQSVGDQEVITTLNIRILQMRVYFQLGEYRLLDAHLDALDIYLLRRKNSLDYHYQAYRRLIGFVRRLRRLNVLDKEKVKQFKARITSADTFPEKSWLLSVIDRP